MPPSSQIQLYNYRQTFMMLQLCIMKTKSTRNLPYDMHLPYDILLHIASFMPIITIQDYKQLFLKYMEQGYELSTMLIINTNLNIYEHRYVTVTEYETGNVVGAANQALPSVLFAPSDDTPNIKPWQAGIEHDQERSKWVSEGVRPPFQMERMQRGNTVQLKKFQKDRKYQNALWEVAVLHPKRKGNAFTTKMKKISERLSILEHFILPLEESQYNLTRALQRGHCPPPRIKGALS